ncbi:MAG: hypothetical protein IJR21_09295 [Synergistaceae bacterium]|nr:hypothetical protein [Synergistaceae bacterium]
MKNKFINKWSQGKPRRAKSLNPMFGAAAMSLSSFCVVSNALRLNFVKI